MNIGKLDLYSDFRSIWPNEQRDFSKWLAKEENLKLLSDALGIDLILEEMESRVGDFKLDILATDSVTNEPVIIENQLEQTNHDHLGKLITYAAGKKAKGLVWFVKKAREEHISAIDWLNEKLDDSIAVFLVELQLWKVDNSKPAVKFEVVSKPNNWARTVSKSEKIVGAKAIQYNFWKEFRESATNSAGFTEYFSLRTPRAQHWYDLSIGMRDARISMTLNTQKNLITCEIYIPENKELYGFFLDNKDLIEEATGVVYEWKNTSGKASRIIATRSASIKSEKQWPEYSKWLMDTAVIMKKEFVKIRHNKR
jgi:hypothetical protein